MMLIRVSVMKTMTFLILATVALQAGPGREGRSLIGVWYGSDGRQWELRSDGMFTWLFAGKDTSAGNYEVTSAGKVSLRFSRPDNLKGKSSDFKYSYDGRMLTLMKVITEGDGGDTVRLWKDKDMGNVSAIPVIAKMYVNAQLARKDETGIMARLADLEAGLPTSSLFTYSETGFGELTITLVKAIGKCPKDASWIVRVTPDSVSRSVSNPACLDFTPGFAK